MLCVPASTALPTLRHRACMPPLMGGSCEAVTEACCDCSLQVAQLTAEVASRAAQVHALQDRLLQRDQLLEARCADSSAWGPSPMLHGTSCMAAASMPACQARHWGIKRAGGLLTVHFEESKSESIYASCRQLEAQELRAQLSAAQLLQQQLREQQALAADKLREQLASSQEAELDRLTAQLQEVQGELERVQQVGAGSLRVTAAGYTHSGIPTLVQDIGRCWRRVCTTASSDDMHTTGTSCDIMRHHAPSCAIVHSSSNSNEHPS
jgi:hypothetical protein